MTYVIDWQIIQNIFSPLFGVIVGAILTGFYQRKLLDQQLEAQKQSHAEMLEAIKAAGEQAQMQISGSVRSANRFARTP